MSCIILLFYLFAISCSKQDEATFDLKSREFQRTESKNYSKLVSDIDNNQKKNSAMKNKGNEPLPSFSKKEAVSENKSNKKYDQKKNNSFLSYFSFNKINFEEKYNSCEELLKINKTVISEQTNKISEQEDLIKQINELRKNINLNDNIDKNKQLEINSLKAEIYRLEKLVEILSLEIE